MQRSGKALTENDIISQLPESADERNGRLIDMAMQSVADFFGSHNLEVKIPTEATQEVARAIDEGRKKIGRTKLSSTKAFFIYYLCVLMLFKLSNKNRNRCVCFFCFKYAIITTYMYVHIHVYLLY